MGGFSPILNKRRQRRIRFDCRTKSRLVKSSTARSKYPKTIANIRLRKTCTFFIGKCKVKKEIFKYVDFVTRDSSDICRIHSERLYRIRFAATQSKNSDGIARRWDIPNEPVRIIELERGARVLHDKCEMIIALDTNVNCSVFKTRDIKESRNNYKTPAGRARSNKHDIRVRGYRVLRRQTSNNISVMCTM